MDPDYRNKLNKRTMEYSCSFMSNTKWQKVFLLLINNSINFRFKTIWNEYVTSWETLNNSSEKALNDEYIQDGAVSCGPLIYKEILYIEIARFEKYKLSVTGTTVLDEQKFENCQKHLNNLGKFKTLEFESHLRLIGYE